MLPFEQAAFFEIVAEPLSFSFRVRILCRYRTPYWKVHTFMQKHYVCINN